MAHNQSTKSSKRLLLTGASGFVGHHILEHVLTVTDWTVVCIASWQHKGLPSRIANLPVFQANRDRVTILTHDLTIPFTSAEKALIGRPNYILNLASDSHVDRSITEPVPFVRNNVLLVLHMLELARELTTGEGQKLETFLQFSTDEVYGEAPIGLDYPEWAPIVPSNPYSGSKAAQEAIAISYWRAFSIPLIVTNTMNVFGERQDWEKFIPLCVKNVLTGDRLFIHAYPDLSKAGSRFYIYAKNVADAMLYILANLPPRMLGSEPGVDRPDRYNIVGEVEEDNKTLALKIAKFLDRPLNYELVNFHSSRPGHDCRYSLSGEKLAKIGWSPRVAFDISLSKVVQYSAKMYYQEQEKKRMLELRLAQNHSDEKKDEAKKAKTDA